MFDAFAILFKICISRISKDWNDVEGNVALSFHKYCFSILSRSQMNFFFFETEPFLK